MKQNETDENGATDLNAYLQAHRSRIRKLSDKRMHIPPKPAHIEIHNPWCVNAPGSTLIIPVADLAQHQVAALCYLVQNGACIFDDVNKNPIPGMEKFSALEPVNDRLTDTFVAALVTNSAGHLFAATDSGVFRSVDNGDSWKFSNAGLPEALVFSLAVNAADHLFAGTGDNGVFRSTDNGNSWDDLNIGFEVRTVRALAINSAGHIFAGVDGVIGGAFRSLNNGDTWEAVNAGLTPIPVLSLRFDSQNRILAGTNDGVFRSVDRTTAVDEDPGAIPPSFALAQNYPNPFNPSTTIAFDLAQRAPVKLRVFDVTGREVAVLANQVFQAGTHKIVFTPNGLADGVYFYRIETGEFAQTKKLTLLK